MNMAGATAVKLYSPGQSTLTFQGLFCARCQCSTMAWCSASAPWPTCAWMPRVSRSHSVAQRSRQPPTMPTCRYESMPAVLPPRLTYFQHLFLSAIKPVRLHAMCKVCGARGGGDGAAQGMFLALNSQHVFMLALETPFKRNVCIGLIRKVRSNSPHQAQST